MGNFESLNSLRETVCSNLTLANVEEFHTTIHTTADDLTAIGLYLGD